MPSAGLLQLANQQTKGLRMVRFDLDGLAVGIDGVFIVAAPGICISEIVMGFREIRLALQGYFIVGNGLIEILQLFVNNSHIVIGFRRLRF